MIVEQRTYTIAVGRLPSYLATYGAEGYDIQRRHLGEPIGFYSTEFGPLSQVVHLWRYEDYGDRTDRRAALFADADWQAFLPKVTPLIVQMENRLLLPTPFWTQP